jgi:hypothetical protein
MIRSTIVILMLLASPAPQALAQLADTSSTTSVALTLPRLSNEALASAIDEQRPQAPAARPTPPPPPPDTPRRRGSMVGYIEDPVVGSKVRVRFESGRHDPTPDRAEFFYAKCGCYQDLAPAHPAYDPSAPGPRPGAASDINFQQLYILGEVAASDRLSVFAELPFRWLQPQSFIPGTGAGFDNQAGLSDIRAGARFGLSAKPGQALTAQVKVLFPSGDPAKGLGTDHWSIEPAFLVYQELSRAVAIEGQFAALAPFGGSNGIPTSSDKKFAGTVLSYGVGPSVAVYQSAKVRVAPVVELVGWHVIDGFETSTNADPAAEANTFNIKYGGRISWKGAADSATGGSFYVGFGHALTDAKWYDDILRVEYRLSF